MPTTDITLLDGAMGQELIKRSGDRPTPLWSTAVMLEHPELVRQVHDDYFAAGATIATTNTYALMPDRLSRVEGLLERQEELTLAATSAARDARDAHGSGRVAGSIGPLGGGSYRPHLAPSSEESARRYAASVALLAPLVDMLVFETQSSVALAEAALRAGRSVELPLWLAVTVDDDDGTRLRSGEPLTELLPVLDSTAPDALLVNCSRPEAITVALDTVATFDLPFGAYANGFTRISEAYLQDGATVEALESRTDLSPAAYADFIDTWLAKGATIVGGCCEVGPAHIAEIHRRVRAAGHASP